MAPVVISIRRLLSLTGETVLGRSPNLIVRSLHSLKGNLCVFYQR